MHSTLRQVQNDLLRQSLDLSELVERTLQATDLMLISLAERANALASAEDGTQQLESEDFHILLRRKWPVCRKSMRWAFSTPTGSVRTTGSPGRRRKWMLRLSNTSGC